MPVADFRSRNERGSALPFHFECSVLFNASAESVFSRLSDPRLLLAHMSGSSWMMAGSRMALELDASQGRAVGASIHMGGRVLGIALSLEEIVTERNPPRRKVWATTGRPRLLVIGHYRMGFDLRPQGNIRRLLRAVVHPAHGRRCRDAFPHRRTRSVKAPVILIAQPTKGDCHGHHESMENWRDALGDAC